MLVEASSAGTTTYLFVNNGHGFSNIRIFKGVGD
jgi:hypothetical protein